MEGWSDFFARSGSSSDFFAHDRQPSRPVLHSFAQYSDREFGLFPSLVHVLQEASLLEPNWCHGDGTGPRVLETLRLASGWCTPADAGNMRTTSKEWYEAFEHTPDEITMARTEQKHAEYFARMTALKWFRYWTRSFALGEPGWYGFPDRSLRMESM